MTADDKRMEVAQEFFQRFYRGDVSGAAELLDENVTYHVPGSHQISGLFQGVQAVKDHLEKVIELSEHTVRVVRWVDWMVGVNHLSAIAEVHVQRRGAMHTFKLVYLLEMTPQNKLRRIEVLADDPAAVERTFPKDDEQVGS
ncbi:MAG TPA: nuclear transport factor 2 family protein [Acidimicrobiales bacterium]|nr:nuclear transport factor 2 family protein [Acidimicrobiales bacterium]